MPPLADDYDFQFIFNIVRVIFAKNFGILKTTTFINKTSKIKLPLKQAKISHKDNKYRFCDSNYVDGEDETCQHSNAEGECCKAYCFATKTR